MLLVFNAFSVFIDLRGTQSALRLFLSFPLSPDFPLLPTPILPSCSQLFIKCNGEKTAQGTAGCCPNVQEPTGERTKKNIHSSSEINQMWRMFAHFMGYVFEFGRGTAMTTTDWIGAVLKIIMERDV